MEQSEALVSPITDRECLILDPSEEVQIQSGSSETSRREISGCGMGHADHRSDNPIKNADDL